MAAIEVIHQRLQRWAQGVTVGDGSGYASVCTIHPNWSPPQPGMTPTMKVSAASDVGQTHAAVQKLAPALRATLLVHYILRPSVDEQAALLDCQPRTVHERVERAHRELAVMLGHR